MKKKYLLLFLIIVIGALLRFYKLGEYPGGFHRDEAFLGYNAYSILKTGKDINGNFLPLHLESFVYTPSGYSYISIPFIAIYGLNEFSTRFASAFFGTLTIILVYLLVIELFCKLRIGLSAYKQKLTQIETRNNINFLALISAGFLAISPWHINLSRTASVITVVVFFISLGFLLFLRWLNSNKLWLLVVSFIMFGVSLFFYIAPYSFLPLFIPLMTLMFYGKSFFSKQGKHDNNIIFVIVFLFTVLIVIPIMITLLSDTLSLRARSLSIFNSIQTKLVLEEKIREDGVTNISIPITRIFHNKPVGFLTQFLDNYFKHFSYEFFFTDRIFPERYRIPLTGVLYLFDLPFLFFGVLYLLAKKSLHGIFLILWVLLSFLGSALTSDDIPNIQRTLLVFPALSIIIALGSMVIFTFLRRFRMLIKVSLVIIIISFAIYNFLFYLHQYYVHENIYRPWYRHDGYKELVKTVNARLSDYQKAVITDRESAPTIFFLFFNQYDPSFFQGEPKNLKTQSIDRVNFGKYEFTQEECPLGENKVENHLTGIFTKSIKENVIYVNSGTCKTPEKNVRVLSEIKRSDNSTVFRILEYRKGTYLN